MTAGRTSRTTPGPQLTVRPLVEGDLDAADHVMRLAFGTFLGLPDPASFMGDVDYVRTRFRAEPSAAFAATIDGDLVGSNFATNWGSVGFFGPLTVHPSRWDTGIGARLMEPVLGCFSSWGTTHAGLFTFAHSPKHVGLYARFGFWPRALTALLRKAVDPAPATSARALSDLAPAERAAALVACAELADVVHPGLDLGREIAATAAAGLGDTVLLATSDALAGFAVCHVGSGSEAGSGTCYVKFGAVRPGHGDDFDRLLSACESFAASRSADWLDVGLSFACSDAMRRITAAGFRAGLQGVTMHRPDEPAYHRADAYVLSDWR